MGGQGGKKKFDLGSLCFHLFVDHEFAAIVPIGLSEARASSPVSGLLFWLERTVLATTTLPEWISHLQR